MSMHYNSKGPAFYGRFSDGKTAQSYDVDVRLEGSSVEIYGPGPAKHVWPYETLHAAEPLTEYAIDALLSSPATPDASLFVGEGTFARKLAEKAPHLTAKAQRWRHAQPWFAGAALMLLAGFAVWALDLSPSRAVAGLLPDKVRTALGEQVIEDFTGNHAVCETPEGRAALDRLTAKLSQAAGGKATFKVVVSDWGLINAFAAPGEQIVLTRGLIEKAESAEEVAGVLAHEMGHGLERHPEAGIVRAIGFTAAFELMMGGSSGTLGNLGIMLAQLSYSREAEREADQQALRLMKDARIGPRGFASFFRRVMKQEEDSEIGKAISGFEVLRTHPNTSERIAAIEKTPAYETAPALAAADWKALKSICNVKKGGPGSNDDPGSNRPSKSKTDGPGRDI